MVILTPVRIAQYLFIALSAMVLSAIIYDWEKVELFVRPLLMPVLMVFFRQGTTGRISPSFMLAVLGLVCSFTGDSLLVFEGNVYFVLGLVAYSFASVFYLLSFYQAIVINPKPFRLIYLLSIGLPLTILVSIVLYLVWGSLEESLIFVIVFCVLISMMTFISVLRVGKTYPDSVIQVMFGSLLFMISGFMLVLYTFYVSVFFSEIWVFVFYILAQWCVIRGLQRHYNKLE